MLYIFKFRPFTDSRRVTIGVCSRVMTSALLLGIEKVVELVDKDSTTITYYLKGFKLLKEPHKAWHRAGMHEG